MLLDGGIAEKILDQLLSEGAEFADLFVEKSINENLLFLNRDLESVTGGIINGLGMRIIKSGQVYYATSSDLTLSALQKIATELLSLSKLGNGQKIAAQTTASMLKVPPLSAITQNSSLSFAGRQGLIHANQTRDFKQRKWLEQSCFEVPTHVKMGIMQELDNKVRARSTLVSQVGVSFIQKEQEIEVFNSLGNHAQDFRPYFRVVLSVTVKDGANQYSAQVAPGEMRGFEYLQKIDRDLLTERPLQQALTMLNAGYMEAGSCPVILGNGFGGVIFHEACGHSLETTAVAKKSSVFWDKLNQQIANPVVSAVDDGTIDYHWGSLTVDDEGRATQKTQLIEKGILKNFLVDYEGYLKTDHPLSGSARRESYLYPPASRMRNTYIEPGASTLDEMLEAMGNGLYAKDLGGGSVDTSTGDFNFSVVEGYKVRGGKICEPVRGATLIGNGSQALKRITHVGKNIALSPGTCGSVSGSIPTTVGQPEILISSIVVGGR